jgi:hypothetical protein
MSPISGKAGDQYAEREANSLSAEDPCRGENRVVIFPHVGEIRHLSPEPNTNLCSKAA